MRWRRFGASKFSFCGLQPLPSLVHGKLGSSSCLSLLTLLFPLTPVKRKCNIFFSLWDCYEHYCHCTYFVHRIVLKVLSLTNAICHVYFIKHRSNWLTSLLFLSFLFLFLFLSFLFLYFWPLNFGSSSFPWFPNTDWAEAGSSAYSFHSLLKSRTR